ITANAPLTTLASTMTTFLQNQATLGQTQVTNYTNAIYSSINYRPGLVDRLDYEASWAATGDPGLTKKIAAYYDGAISMTDLINWINAQGGGFGVPSGKQVYSIESVNLQAKNQDGNYCHNNGLVCGSPILEPYGAQERFYSDAKSDFLNYYENDLWILLPFWGYVATQKIQDRIQIYLDYTTYDPAADNNAQVWGNLVTQMNGFKGGWMTNILPAIGAWESQV
ncbi:TIGR04388 family protein, partial [Leptospira kmetyi]